ncbi:MULTISPECIES: M4 family metallopeptidase [Rhodanobacter]|uniref:M4 family metallopeptidase n=1 Tax=Rhodanobacter TaxID=75309 RepID=UPI0004140DD1|nr:MULTISPECIES: pre-peptidase C-terminal domain-containing protein [Rhodanobacter]KZC20120.1 peptidase [Rhodanobacter denitrificans]UJJ51993.1 M4 family metallopeptidase [Rhodanobacter denitrificans]UJM94737.1 M4 family metallopeptidase [Rhodanobacter denitrificans]UJM98267.1 M4 family metallopeptidase [Rhodanobacter denitrificans]UJN22320.1 M4 family metallopeptidase [Rhodanobacter denitrificans]
MPNHYRLKLLVAAIGMATASVATAANTKTLRAQNLGAVPVSSLAAHLNLGQNMSLAPRGAAAIANGHKVVRQQQMYRGVPVYGRSIAVVQDASGNALRATGELMPEGQLGLASVTPKLDGGRALAALRSHAHTSLAGGATVGNEQTDLFVYPQDNGTARLVYRVSYFVGGANPSRPTAIVDANTGEVIQSWNGLTDASATGPGGNTKTGKYLYGTNYAALDVTQSGSTCTLQNTNVKTNNLRQGTTGSVVSFTCPNSDTDAINGAYSPVNDAHHFGGVTHDMYMAYVGVAPLNFQLVMNVHYKLNYENAFWNGTAMYFGDGASTFYPLVSLDVTSHEISHGYTEQHSALQYSGQSGGINEAYSDIAGEAAEFFDRGSNDWLVGADIMKSGTALRWMCTPTQDGGSIDNAANFTSTMDVHYSSGVYNKAFCLLAKTAGWDTKKAFQVFALANKVYWNATTSFNSGACGVESAAQDLVYNKSDVTTAFAGVGVACAGGGGGGTTTELQNNVGVTGVSGATGADNDYFITVPTGASNLVMSISGGTGDADLYTKFGSAPTTSSYDCRPYKTGNAESCSVAAPSAGKYYIKVHGYSAYSGVTVKASYSTGGGGSGGLQNGVPVTGLAGSASQELSYTVTVPAGSNLTIAISSGTGDADLYVKKGLAPTTTSYDCRPYLTGNNETCSFSAASGTYYIKVRGYTAFSGVSLKATW